MYLVVDGSGAKRWLLRIVVQGRRKDIGLACPLLNHFCDIPKSRQDRL